MQTLMMLASAACAGYTQRQADAFVGAQQWNESGYYVDGGLKVGYSGYYCLCQCSATPEGVFCKGGGLTAGQVKVADFLGVYSETSEGGWTGSVIAHNTPSPFTDVFSQREAGGPANYTGTSPGDKGFAWRGYMTGADCEYRYQCNLLCDTQQYNDWVKGC